MMTHAPHPMIFGRWLSREIENRLWTRDQFATKSGVSRPTVQRWLRNAQPPRGRAIVQIAKALGMDRTAIESSFAGGHQKSNGLTA